MIRFSKKKCTPLESGIKPMKKIEIINNLKCLKGWSFENGQIIKPFVFKNYYETTSFVNAIAWIANQEDHHPEISFGYKNCIVRYSTHAVGGISENDFICAAKIEALTY